MGITRDRPIDSIDGNRTDNKNASSTLVVNTMCYLTEKDKLQAEAYLTRLKQAAQNSNIFCIPHVKAL